MAESLVGKIVSNAGKQWNRNTVADGNWLNTNTVQKFNENDKTLAEAIESLSAAMEHFTPEITPSAWPCEPNKTIQTIKQNADGSLNVTYQSIETSTTSDETLWSWYKQNAYDSVVTGVYTETDNDINHEDGELSENLTIPAGIYDIKIEVLYEPTQSNINNKLDIAISKSTSIDDALYQTFILFDDTLSAEVQSEWITGIIDLKESTTLRFLIKGESAQGRYKLNNIYINSIVGAKGDDGISPTVSTEQIEGGNRVTFTYDNGTSTSATESIDVMSGVSGENGTSVIVKSIREFTNIVGTHTKGGTEITLEWNEGQTVKTSAFSAFNGEKGQDGSGASYTFDINNTLSGDGSSAAPICVNTNVIATQTWVEGQNFTTSAGIEANKQYVMTTSGWTSANYISAVNTDNDTISGDGVTNFLSINNTYVTKWNKVTEKQNISDMSAYPTFIGMTESNYYCWSGTSGEGGQWLPISDKFYSKTESDGRYLQNSIDSTLSGNGTTQQHLGANTNVIPTKDWLDDNYLPLSGGTVSGQTIISGTDNFDNSNLKFICENQTNIGRIGLNNGGLSIKSSESSNNNYTQINISPSGDNNKRIALQKSVNGTTSNIGYLIPADINTSVPTSGFSNDGILHIVVES